ncbi:PepSY domain-containing protein [Methylobacterium sp. WL69]|uniref:PepSY-associated TM helix domain-containing protein n=1 Tax=Methylobacterium sp. WL69 TaxID=2603893 RepID=UPI0011CB0078|nr:PepSY-associated TM helix domain-containing protein [Methylobacterium sp. WL69]TXM68063.1 PepSY domain-containing protein [Methylobacterium sp. WL69]
MKNGFRQSMAWLHTWAGLVVGWVLLAVFVTGTASYYRADISRWMRPELHQAAASTDPASLARAAEIGVAHMAEHAPNARTWFIGLPRAESPVLDLFWRTKPGTPPGHAVLDPQTGAPATVRNTKGGDFLYRFHFELHMAPLWGRWIVGICAMIMLVAIVSGIITHRRIFSDFFTLRRDKAAQRGWLDAHNVTGVLALPFHLMITYTGVVTLAVMYMPWGITTAYRGDNQAFYAESGQITAQRPALGRPGQLAPIGPMVARAVAMVPEPLERLSVVNPKDANATVVAVFEEPHGLSHAHPQIAFDGTTGAVVEVLQGGLKPAAKTFTTMVGLHEAHFAGEALRGLFFVCGLMGCAMVASGLILWSVARLPKRGTRPFLGLRIVQALNIGTVAGLPAGIAAYFLANRLLPVGLADRADWEVRAFFAVWVLATLLPLARPQRRAWVEAMTALAALTLAVPVIDVLTIPGHPLRFGAGEPALFLWFDGVLVALAALFAVCARKIGRYEGPRPKRRTAPAEAARVRAGQAERQHAMT